VDFRPRLDEPALPPGKLTTDELDRVDREDAEIILIVRVEVWSVVRSRGFDKHPNDDSEEPGDLGHRWSAAAGLYAADFPCVNVQRRIRRLWSGDRYRPCATSARALAKRLSRPRWCTRSARHLDSALDGIRRDRQAVSRRASGFGGVPAPWRSVAELPDGYGQSRRVASRGALGPRLLPCGLESPRFHGDCA